MSNSDNKKMFEIIVILGMAITLGAVGVNIYRTYHEGKAKIEKREQCKKNADETLENSLDLFVGGVRELSQIENGTRYDMHGAALIGKPARLGDFKSTAPHHFIGCFETDFEQSAVARFEAIFKTKRGSFIRAKGFVGGKKNVETILVPMSVAEVKEWLLDQDQLDEYEEIFGPVPLG